MKTKSISCLFYLLFSIVSYAQRFEWVSFTPVVPGGSGNGGKCITIDNEGNLYTTANFGGSILVGNDTVHSNVHSVLITKWSPSGLVLNYRLLYGSIGNLNPLSATYDEINEQVIFTFDNTGPIIFLEGDTSFANSSAAQMIRMDKDLRYISNFQLTHTYNSPLMAKDGYIYSSNNYQSVIRKLNVNNEVMWQTNVATGSYNIADIVVSDNFIYVIGYYMSQFPIDQVILGGVGVSLPAPGNSDQLILFKLDTAGNVIQGRYILQTSGHGRPAKVACDNEGNVYLTSSYVQGGQQVDNFTLSPPTGANDGVALKLNQNLEVQWLTEFHHSGGNMETNAIAVSESGKVLVTGLYGGTGTFGNFQTISAAFGSNFLVLLDQEDGNISYATQFGSLGGTGRPFGVAKNGDKYYITGLSFGSFENNGGYGCYNVTKAFQYVTFFNDELFEVSEVNLTFDGGILIAFPDNQDAEYKWFLNGEVIESESQSSIVPSSNGTYVVNVSYFGCLYIDTLIITTVGNNSITSKELKLSVFPNPANNKIFIKGLENHSIVSLTDLNGKIIQEWKNTNSGELKLPQVYNGIYFIKVQSQGQIFNHKLIIQQ